MRWDALFADLEAEVQAEEALERRAEVVDRIRSELGRLRLVDRLAPALGSPGPLRIGISGHPSLSGALTGLGADWLLVAQAGGSESLVALAAVQLIQGLSHASAEPGWEGKVGARLDLRVALRRLVRDRSAVTVRLTSADALTGRLARVGADHVELAEIDAGGRVSGAGWTIPLAAIAFVQRR